MTINIVQQNLIFKTENVMFKTRFSELDVLISTYRPILTWALALRNSGKNVDLFRDQNPN